MEPEAEAGSIYYTFIPNMILGSLSKFPRIDVYGIKQSVFFLCLASFTQHIILDSPMLCVLVAHPCLLLRQTWDGYTTFVYTFTS